MIEKITNLNRLWSSIIITELKRQGSNQFYLSPGLRNAPLLWAVQNIDNINYHTSIDERGASYRALGSAKYNNTPAVLICTSGTAMANYFPAIIEAKKSKTPLIVISSDRPEELVSGQANQTIEQPNLYGNYVIKSIDLGTPDTERLPKVLASTIAEAFALSKYNCAPIHLNLRFREPLDGSVQRINEHYFACAKSYFEDFQKNIQTFCLESNQLPTDIKEILQKSERPLIVIGELHQSYKSKEAINYLKNCHHAHFYCDITSGLKYDLSINSRAIPSFDHPETIEKLKNSNPDLIIHIGGRLTAKHYDTYINGLTNTALIHFNDDLLKQNPTGSITHKVKINPIDALKAISEIYNSKTVSMEWINFNNTIEKKESIIESSELSFAYISKKAIETLNENTNLYIANSSIIRSFNNYTQVHLEKHFPVYVHRGVSGIEGFINAAIGLAETAKQKVVLFIGDISFLHDLNALASLRKTNANIHIVLLNNNGGGIFKLLPISKEIDLIPLLTTEQNLNYCEIIKAFNINHKMVSSKEEYLETLDIINERSGIYIHEVVIDDVSNIKVYEALKTVKDY